MKSEAKELLFLLYSWKEVVTIVSQIILGMIIGVFMTAALFSWFISVWRVLEAQRTTLIQLKRQLAASSDALEKAKDTPYFESVHRAMEVNASVYKKAAEEYALLRHKPLHRLPAYLMGFQSMDERKHSSAAM